MGRGPRIERLLQRYTRSAEHLYAYETRGGAFRAELAVDESGVVIGYGDVWRRVRND